MLHRINLLERVCKVSSCFDSFWGLNHCQSRLDTILDYLWGF